MTHYELLSIAVSLVAVLIALVSLVRARRVQSELLGYEADVAALARKQLEMIQSEEAVKRDGAVSVDLVEVGSSYRFVVRNVGTTEVTRVGIAVGNEGSSGPLVPSQVKRLLPFPKLRPSQSFNLTASIHINSPRQFAVRATWKNQDGSDGLSEHHVSV